MAGLTFKGLLRQDMGRTFLNPMEFAEIHVVNGKKMPIVIDDNELMKRGKRVQSHMDGVYVKQMLIYANATDFGPRPPVNSIVSVDKIDFVVADCQNEGGAYAIRLERNKN